MIQLSPNYATFFSTSTVSADTLQKRKLIRVTLLDYSSFVGGKLWNNFTGAKLHNYLAIFTPFFAPGLCLVWKGHFMRSDSNHVISSSHMTIWGYFFDRTLISPSQTYSKAQILKTMFPFVQYTTCVKYFVCHHERRKRNTYHEIEDGRFF